MTLTERFRLSPWRLFLADGIGAAVTAACVGLVLPRLPGYIAMPHSVLSALALTGLAFASFSLGCAALRVANWPRALRAITGANAAYCIVTAALLVHFRGQLLPLDWSYFCVEIAIVAALVGLELKVSRAPESWQRSPSIPPR